MEWRERPIWAKSLKVQKEENAADFHTVCARVCVHTDHGWLTVEKYLIVTIVPLRIICVLVWVRECRYAKLCEGVQGLRNWFLKGQFTQVTRENYIY